MKSYTLIIAGILLVCACKEKTPTQQKKLGRTIIEKPAEPVDTTPFEQKAKMDFNGDTLHNFGKLKEGQIVACTFTFKNTGRSPLNIRKASGSCGCTMPDYPKAPVLPGEKGEIKVKFNSANKMGSQLKSVILYSNAQVPEMKLFIKSFIAL